MGYIRGFKRYLFEREVREMDAVTADGMEKWQLGRYKTFALLVLLWAAIYLPGLGTPEFRGEEAHRTLPAVRMLEKGEWMMPYIAGEPYFNKPPGINWLVAASYMITGVQNEWSSRLVSVVGILGFVTLAMFGPGRFLTEGGRVLTAVIYMTAIGLVDKGRQIEIESIFVTLTCAAVLWWMGAFSLKWKGPGLWLVPGLLIGYGMLVKGPPILLFFYAVILSVAIYTKRWTSVLSIWHGIAILILIGMNYGWAYLGPMQYSQEEMAGTLTGDILLRFLPKSFGYWAENIFESLYSFAPWIFFLPVLWDRQIIGKFDGEQASFFRGARMGMIIGYLVIMLMPQTETRYVLPVYGIAAIALGWALSYHDHLGAGGQVWKWMLIVLLFASIAGTAAGLALEASMDSLDIYSILAAGIAVTTASWMFLNRKKLNGPVSLGLATAAVIGVVVVQFGWLFMDAYTARTEKFRPTLAKVHAAVPDNETIYIYSSEYETWLFYVRKPFKHIFEPEDIDQNVEFMLIEKLHRDELNDTEAYTSRHPRRLVEFDERIKGGYELIQLSTPPKSPGDT